jgi:hypothetical protein
LLVSLLNPISEENHKGIEVLWYFQVTGMQAGATVMLQAQNGTLRVILLEHTTSIQNLDIQLHGGASWLYQW